MREAFGAVFDVDAGYLDTPSVGLPPVRTAEAVEESIRRWRRGADRAPDFDAAVETSREAFGQIIGVPADRVAVGSSAAQLISAVAAGVPAGATVLAAQGEFTSVTFPFAARPDVTVHEVPFAELPAHVPGHDLVAVAVVQSADGAVADLDALREAADRSGVPVLLDVTQAAGWLPLQLDWADWVVGAGYKWLLAPRGCAWLAVHPRAHERTVPVAANWYAGEDRWSSVYGLPLRLAQDARAFDLSPAWYAFVGAAESLPYLAALDAEAVRAHCAGLADDLLGRLGLPPRGSAIVSLDIEGAAERLADAGVRAAVRAGRARLGFHLCNTDEDVAMVAGVLGAPR
ncbi:aminotransferase class V-fold PLP-dependent enzyme [Sediminivirga luteola]|uniref:Aminotransferase class V n=1 Tax=Sediminivirga luteola TaxID=1774748 RepID=A0A8J2XIQ9_9MICO|nr:aminotransferase class V-fold PLP-dependent enzyme [Sediminivirga luteola]MCI2264653.1 aminotransferase class V-fold PLP-dependent enzyme [Sediminivirga luteola]GGA02723.1 aminotransferase class V [Sediminivirga luteola]